ncbi:UNVERIFIED_CONTAM: hypothetical protein Sradi_4239200 [Sesamum radiatum]|uniref:DUF2428 domain-containing protein n=1 Tax=Sesamum radiatum TaxID=300843 RepID=A0AAW2P4C4_SESRA
MSAKWRAIQHRHRYTYSAVVFPPHFVQALNQAPHDAPFFAELRHLVSLNSTYAQLEHVKKLAAATLASVLAKCKNFRSLIEGCFRQLCEEYGGAENVINGKRFCVSRAALSMMSTPKLGYLVQVVEQCANLVALDVVSGLHTVVAETNESSRPSPIVMEQCQEALSCMYYLLQRFPQKFYNVGGEHYELSLNNCSVLQMAFVNVLSILKSHAFSRDCLVAAGVGFLQPCRGILTAVSRTVLDTHYAVSSDDIQSSLQWAEGSENIKLFLRKIASDLLCLGPRCKGRYVPLASLTRRLGAKTILGMNPGLLFETIKAYIDDDVGHCLPPILHGLAFGLAKLRSNLNTYALPVLLELDVDCIFSMLASIGIGRDESPLFAFTEISCTDMVLGVEQQSAVLVSLLKVSRILALMEGDIDWCESSSVSPEETLFLNPKTASLPSSLELRLMRTAVPLNMRCCSTAFQMKWNSLFRKFFSRVRTALERQIKLGTWKPLVSGDENGVFLYEGTENTVSHRAKNLFDFTKWLSCFLFFSCYPSAPYERKIMAMDLILIMLNVWPVVPTLPGNKDAFVSEANLYPYSKSLTLPDSTLLLVGSIIDSWDRLRESSFRILLYFPTPLPGICSPDLVREAIIWAKKLICSPRVRETDAGALTLRLLFRKYVLELSWIVRPSCNRVSFDSEPELPNGDYQSCRSSPPAVTYLTSLIDWLLAAVEDAERNLSEACKNSFVHGILLTLRYTFEEMDWNSNVLLHSTAEMRCVLERLLELVMRITSLALWVVSADAWYLPDDMEEMVDDEAFLLEIQDEIESSGPKSQDEVKVTKVVEEARPSEQVVMVGCWLAMKEVSLLLGTIIRKVPLPTSDEMREVIGTTADNSVGISDAMLDLKQLETIGNHFLEVLLKMKHNGAIDKTRAGFTALCNRLLCSNDPRLCKLTESWMEQLMQRTVAKGQTVDDLLRRSAGIPAAFIAFFLSEPEGTPKRLLPRALRAAFNDTNLATDTSGFSAEALIISIRSFSSSYWEVRNSACLAYTALVRRMLGFLNIQKRESARRALTGLEFFHRYPSLHSFLFNELKVATEFLLDGSSEQLGSNLKNVVHPSLCPMLILLSRLKPSPISSETGDALDPFLFMPFIRRCSTQSNFRIRVLASGALTGLVANEKLKVVMLNIASELPTEKSSTRTPGSPSTLDLTNETFCSFNSIHGMLLQLNSLVDINCRNLADSSKRDNILHELVQILAKRSWIGRPQQCTCPILNGCILKVLDNMLSVARTCEASRSACDIWNLLWELSSECLDLEPADGPRYFDPTIQELRKQAATSYFNCVFQTSKEVVEDDLLMRSNFPSPATRSLRVVGMEVVFSRFQERLIRSMSDTSYEVRIATLKWLLLFLKRRESLGNNNGDQFYSEAMKICSTIFDLQDTVTMLLVTRHAKTRQTLICCLGICAKQISNLCMRFLSSEVEKIKIAELIQTDPSKMFSDFYESLSYFVDLIEQSSDASQPVNMRKAAAESMIASGLLAHAEVLGSLILRYPVSDGSLCSNFKPEEAISLFARKVLDLWLTCIKLLEDEDVG